MKLDWDYLDWEVKWRLNWGVNSIKADLFQEELSTKNKIKVWVVDTWVYIDHTDLKDNIWVNENEIKWNWIDDDGNWFIDDINWANFNWSVLSNVSDIDWHWTHVAWTIWAVVNWLGIYWVNSNTNIVPIKVFAPTTTWSKFATDLMVIEWIKYAADTDVRVLNLSLGWPTTSSNNSICDAIDYAYNKGTYSIASAWNSNNDASWYSPANCDNIITVGALNTTWSRSSFSNYWSVVDVSAPWEFIYSTYNDWSYKTMDWTSMSAPHVTGLVSAMLAYKSDLTFNQIENILKNESDSVTYESGKPIWNKVNMEKVINYIKNTYPEQETLPELPEDQELITEEPIVQDPVEDPSNSDEDFEEDEDFEYEEWFEEEEPSDEDTAYNPPIEEPVEEEPVEEELVEEEPVDEWTEQPINFNELKNLISKLADELKLSKYELYYNLNESLAVGVRYEGNYVWSLIPHVWSWNKITTINVFSRDREKLKTKTFNSIPNLTDLKSIFLKIEIIETPVEEPVTETPVEEPVEDDKPTSVINFTEFDNLIDSLRNNLKWTKYSLLKKYFYNRNSFNVLIKYNWKTVWAILTWVRSNKIFKVTVYSLNASTLRTKTYIRVPQISEILTQFVKLTPEPVQPEPVKPEPVQPEPVKPEPVQPEPVQPEPVQPEPVQPEPVQPEPVKPEPVKPEPVQPEPVQPEPVKPEPVDEEEVSISNIKVYFASMLKSYTRTLRYKVIYSDWSEVSGEDISDAIVTIEDTSIVRVSKRKLGTKTYYDYIWINYWTTKVHVKIWDAEWVWTIRVSPTGY